MNNDELFCPKCLIHDCFFVGGGSWSPDNCPDCGETVCITFENLSPINQVLAEKRFKRMWKKEYNIRD